MTLEQLRIFLVVAELEHLTQAAAKLNLSPSAVSAAVRSLEQRYGITLFHRVGRRIELTETGRTLVPEARATLAAARAAEQALAELGGMLRGCLRIHASQTIASYWAPPRLVAFRERYPAVEVQIEIGNSQGVAAAIMEGSADLGLVEDDTDMPELHRRAVATDRLMVVVPQGHPWSDGRPLGAEELAAGRWVMREPGSGTRSVFEDALRGLGLEPGQLQVVLELPSNESVRSAVQAGPLAAVMSELVAAPDLAAGRLVQAGLSLPPRAFSMLRHRERQPSRAARALEAIFLEAGPPRPSG
ncbi:LysR family transcriptional regulator [Geminicoccus roseus]|uniref:LysR family transcriptional regulator n=1 Tax=Geminicoccus roseus TaxID=404900 RepID=UPI0003F67522|nr:LysR family transcriptional regulator [Geminicoccus roseus]